MSARHSPFRRFITSRIFLVILLGLCFAATLSYARTYYRNYQVQHEIEELRAQVAKLEAKKIESLELLDYVKSDDFIEEKARTELSMMREGENVVIVHDGVTLPLHGEESETVEDEEVDLPRGPLFNAKKWWYYFTHND